MRFTKRGIDFNKEIIIGGMGGFVGAPLFGSVSSLFTSQSHVISLFTTLGSMIGATGSWLFARIYNKKKREELFQKKIEEDIKFYAPAAVTIALLFGYPTVFFMTIFTLNRNINPALSSFIGQLCGVIIFLILMNIYRYILKKRFNVKL